MRFIKRNKIIILALSMMLLMISGCGSSSPDNNAKKEPVDINVYVPEGLPAITTAKLMKDKPEIAAGYNVTYTVEKTSDSLVAKVLNEEADIAVVPSTLPAQAANKGLDYKLAATAGWGSLYVISSEDIKDLASVKGKEIYTIGKGLTPDVVLRYVLSQNSVDPDKDVTLTYLNGATELAPAFISGKAKVAVVPEPMLSQILSKKPETKIVASLNDQWKEKQSSNYGYPQSSLIIKGKVAKEHKAFVDSFLKEYEKSIAFANEKPEELGQYSEDLGLTLSKALAPKVMERANINYVAIDKSKDDYAKYYDVIMKFAPKSIGGKIPDEGLYMQK